MDLSDQALITNQPLSMRSRRMWTNDESDAENAVVSDIGGMSWTFESL